MKRSIIKISLALVILLVLLFARAKLTKLNHEKMEFYYELSRKQYLSNANMRDFTSFTGKTFKEFELNDLTGKPWSLNRDKSFLKVLILFRVNDCGSCLREHTLWEKIHEKFSKKNVLVIGICHTEDIEDILYFVEEKNIHFPVLHDPGGIVKENLGIKPSPLRIMLNQDNEILEIQRPDSELSHQKELLSRIRQYLRTGIDGAKYKNKAQEDKI